MVLLDMYSSISHGSVAEQFFSNKYSLENNGKMSSNTTTFLTHYMNRVCAYVYGWKRGFGAGVGSVELRYA